MSAAQGDSTESREALAELCEHYYEPVLAYLKRAGHDRDGGARDLAHGFFEDLLGGRRLSHLERERGRFRSYLLGALKHFLSHQRTYAQAVKRGGQAEQFSLNETGTEMISEPGTLPPDAWFDQQWALALLSRALAVVEDECRAAGNESQFQLLSPWLTGEAEHGDQAEVGKQIGVPPNTLRSMIHRLRRRFRQAVKDEIARTLVDSANVEEEMGALFAALGGAPKD